MTTHQSLFEDYDLSDDLAFHAPYREALLQLSLQDCERVLQALGPHASLLDDPGRAAFHRVLFTLSDVPAVSVTPGDFEAHRSARAGTSNPESHLPDFWRSQIVNGHSAYVANDNLHSGAVPGTPVWSFMRFGATYTHLPDGRWIAIGGEHEDHYDEDFCIYADVTVFDGHGGISHYIYPEDVFPPTDFHTATLIGDVIWVIGSLGYPGQRHAGQTQVLCLDIGSFEMTKVETSGTPPGWINRHEAVLEGDQILISGGMLEPGWVANEKSFALDLTTQVWRQI